MFRAALAPSIRKSYRRTLEDLAKFLGFQSIEEITSAFQELDILRYIAFLFNAGFSHSSILSRLSAVTFWIRIKSWPLVTQSHAVARALKGVRALSERPHKSKFPITPDVLRCLCLNIPKAGLSNEANVRLRAMFLLAFHAFLRVGELCGSRHALCMENIDMQPNYFSVKFSSYKFSAGRCPSVFIPANSSVYCPVRALNQYLEVRGSHPGFLFLTTGGEPLSIPKFRSELALVVRAAGLHDRGITPHSFRVGAATSASALGIPEETIQCMGRWTSRAFVRYIKFQVNKL